VQNARSTLRVASVMLSAELSCMCFMTPRTPQPVRRPFVWQALQRTSKRPCRSSRTSATVSAFRRNFLEPSRMASEMHQRIKFVRSELAPLARALRPERIWSQQVLNAALLNGALSPTECPALCMWTAEAACRRSV